MENCMFAVLKALLPDEASADTVIGLHVAYLFATAALLFIVGWKLRGTEAKANASRSACTLLLPMMLASIALIAGYAYHVPGLYHYGVNYEAVLNDFVWLTMFCRAGWFASNPKVRTWMSKERQMGYIRRTDSWVYPWEEPACGFDEVRYGPPTGWDHLYEGLHAIGKFVRSYVSGLGAAFSARGRSNDGTNGDGESMFGSLKATFFRMLGRPVAAA
jgi:hypothetical protein